MNVALDLLASLSTLIMSSLSYSLFGLNTIDLVIVAVMLFYLYEGYALGFVLALIDFLSFVLSFVAGLLLFGVVGSFIASQFSLAQGFANAIGFFLVALIGEIVFTLLLRRVTRLTPFVSRRQTLQKVSTKANHFLGIIPGFLSGYILLSFLLTLVIALPTSAYLKESVTSSHLGSILVSHTTSIQQSIHGVFGGALEETLNVMTIKPESSETVKLHFSVANPTIDSEAEDAMLVLVNKERREVGLSELTMDESLRELARTYSKMMFQRGFFSHYTPEGKSPFDRMDEAQIIYQNAGENLALAPSVQLSHQGLMNSPGHKANILSEDYNKVGIGVMDGGIYGKMFSQEFTN
ncbi:MAG: CvpA family protein [Candidatus Levybacteria bacterium]|nr:CvpA family protein [Candidatus Levybacteria bacterium]